MQGDWHHRVPDFQLVYCGPKKSTLTKEEKSDKKLQTKEQLEEALKK